MRKQLRLINGMQCILAFEFDHHATRHHQVGAKTAIELNPIVDHRNWFLSLDWKTSLIQFVGETCLIGGFQQSWTQLTMNSDRGPNDLGSQVSITHESSVNVREEQFCDEWPFAA